MELRKFGLTFNALFEKWMFLIVPCSLILGFLFERLLSPYVPAVPYLFAFVTLTMAMGCGLDQLRGVMKRPGIMVLTFMLAHVLSAVIAYAVGSAIFGSDSPYVVGLVLFTIIPLGVSSVLWVGMSGGSIPLMLAMVVLDSLLSPLVVPAGIHLFFGAAVEVKAGPLMLDLTILIVLPTVIGIILYEWSKGRIAERVKPITAPFSKLCFVSVVALNAAAIAPYVEELKQDMAMLIPIVIVLVGICYAVGFIFTARLRNHETQTTVSYATGMRNISLGIVLAMGYFSPLAAVPVVLSILIQQPFATVHHYILQKINKNKTGESVMTHVR
ncbi:bile acid:sodium symporter family protein [Paenibacillus sp. strain BS8-2]